MTFGLHIAFRNMDASEAAEALVRQRVAELEQVAHRISACRVVLDCEHRQNHVGRLYRVHIDLTVPGGTVVVSRDPGSNHAHDDLPVAIHDAFETATRKIRSLKTSPAKRERSRRRKAPGVRVIGPVGDL